MRPSLVPCLAAALALAAPAAARAGYTGRVTLGLRGEATDGLSEFYASYRRENPFPAYAPADGSAGSRLREAVVATEGYQSLRSLYEPYAVPDFDGRRGYLFLVAEGRYAWESGWRLAGRLASRELSQAAADDGTLAARGRNTFFVDEFYARYARWDDWRTFDAGRRRFVAARGFVHDDYQTLVDGEADLGLAGLAPFTLGGAVVKVEGEHLDESQSTRWDGEGLFDPADHAYLAQVKAGYPISLLESVELSYLRFQERDGYFADLFNPVVADVAASAAARATATRAIPAVVDHAAEACRLASRSYVAPGCFVDAVDYGLGELAARQYESFFAPLAAGAIGGGRSFLNYAVLEGDKYAGPVLLSGALVGEWGRVTLTDVPAGVRQALDWPERIDFATRGLLAYASAEAPAGPLRLRVHYLFSSGENRQFKSLADGDRYDAFLGVRPYIRLTNIFFAGGISENLRSGSIAPSGYYGHGVWAPVADVEWRPAPPLTLVATGAYLNAQRTPVPVEGLPDRGAGYGWEGDLTAYYAPLDWLRVSGEADYFAPGDFFVDMPAVWKAAVGVDFVFAAD